MTLAVTQLTGFGAFASGEITYRYWKLNVTAAANSGAQVEIAELTLEIATVDQTADMTSNTAPSPNVASASAEAAPAWQGFDKDNATTWSSTDAAPEFLKFDFGAGNGKSITGYSITSRSTGQNYPTAWTLEGSNNDADYTVQDTQTAQTFGSGEKKTYTFTPV